MRRIVLGIILVALLLLGCSNSQTLQAEETFVSPQDFATQAPSEHVITHDAYEGWEKGQSSDYMQDDLVKTEADAIAIANAIVEANVGDQEWKKLSVANVWEDADRGVWIVSYDPVNEDSSTMITGGRVNIAVSKHDAQVVKMWAEE